MFSTTPSTCPPTWLMILAHSRAWSLCVRPTANTSSVPSLMPDSRPASVTGSSGGASRITRWSLARWSIRACIRCDPSSSLGFGGVRPAAMSRTLGCSVSCSASTRRTWPASSWDSPTEPGRSKMVANIGRRRSASRMTVGWPDSPSTRASVADIVDLPSPAFALVTTMLRGAWSTLTKRRLVRICRNDAEHAGPGLGLDVGDGAQPGVELAAQEDQAVGDEQADDGADEDVPHRVRGHLDARQRGLDRHDLHQRATARRRPAGLLDPVSLLRGGLDDRVGQQRGLLRV